MSEPSHQAGPDLHAIFGIDGDPRDPEPVISLERRERQDGDLDDDAGIGLDANVDLDATALDDPHVIRVDPDREVDLATDPDVELDGERHVVELDETVEPRPVELVSDSAADPAGVPAPGEFTGITKPSRRGSSPRFLTDVIVDLGLASRGQVEDAL